MRCPECDSDDTRVVDSRTTGDAIRRRRECAVCGERFSTLERLEQRLPAVIKKSGVREPFNRHKVLHGIEHACRKRPIGPDDLERAVRQVETALIALREAEIPSERVGEAVMSVLQQLDSVAYVRFASVYLEFDSVERFAELIAPLRDPRSEPTAPHPAANRG